MTRKECLEQAMGCVLRDRNNSYGGPEDSFGLIADLWTAYTGHVFIGRDVAAMMALLKLARMKRNARHLDSAVDLAGYAACFAECASAETAHPVPFAPKAEDEIEPEYEPHERVQVRYAPGRWCGAEYICRSSRWGHVVFVPGEKGEQTFRNEDVRKMPKAEGCEDLVFDEARMRESMPGIVPQDGLSDMDKPWHLLLHNPTGEELAEMAEEEPHV